MLRLPFRCGGVALAGALFVACASHPPEQAAAPPLPVPDEGNVEKSEDFVEAPRELTLPSAACVFATQRWNGIEAVTELRLSADGPAYALVTNPHARLHLAVGPRTAAAAIEVEDGGFAMRGFLKKDAFALHPGKALILGDFAIPSAFADLGWTDAREGEVSISYDIGPGVEGTSLPLGASVPCADLTIDFATFEPTAPLGDVSNEKYEQLRLGHAIDLRTKPGGKVVAQLRAQDDEDSLVQVLDKAGRSKRILWWRNTAVVFGWVDAAELRPRSVGLTGYGVGHGRPALPRSSAIIDVRRCDRDVALFAEVEGQRAKVGSVKPGTALEVLSRGGDLYSVQAQSRSIAVAPNARLLASARELATCALVPSDAGTKLPQR